MLYISSTAKFQIEIWKQLFWIVDENKHNLLYAHSYSQTPNFWFSYNESR